MPRPIWLLRIRFRKCLFFALAIISGALAFAETYHSRPRTSRRGAFAPSSGLQITLGRPNSPKKFPIRFQRFKPWFLFKNISTTLNMIGQIIDGKAIAEVLRAEIKDQVSKLKEETGKVPGLAVILVGGRTDSATYVRMKKKACEECGIASFGYEYSETVTQDELQSLIRELNDRADIHGILVQLPLPQHIDEHAVLNTVDKSKDVDGLHPLNVASLCSTSTHVGNTKLNWNDFTQIPFHIACTPQGCIELLDRSGIQIQGKNAVVIGRSNLVGLPLAMLLMHRNATVTIVHSRTLNAPELVSRADIVLAAVGRPEIVKGEWLKPGCVVIDVGINSKHDPTTTRGYKLVGDVDFAEAKEVASLITPVPGGVGPMTIAMLLRNTLNQCRRS